ncbi:MAG: sel1 repeat family protein [Lachnospiraceae bacterium]|nr:sel1 repeat family protein [Lachnospiraceae bacterium]
MTVKEARKIVQTFDDETQRATEEEFFMFTEAMDFLINEEHNPRDMMYLGGVYYGMKRFDLALKYYEMAASYDFDEAYDCLGYIWYYGRTGERDYKKAFEYFSKLKDKGDLVAAYKVADMYKNGYYVDKNMELYKEIIEDLYLKVAKCRGVFDPVPEVYTRLAHIRLDEGKEEDAVDLFLKAKDWLAQRIKYSNYFGNLNIMKWLVDDLYEIIEFDNEYFDLFDLYYLLKTPHIINFVYDGKLQRVESVMEGDECTVCFNGKWFRSRDDFFKDAVFEGTNERLASAYDKCYGYEVVA